MRKMLVLIGIMACLITVGYACKKNDPVAAPQTPVTVIVNDPTSTPFNPTATPTIGSPTNSPTWDITCVNPQNTIVDCSTITFQTPTFTSTLTQTPSPTMTSTPTTDITNTPTVTSTPTVMVTTLATSFLLPHDVTADTSGNVYVADTNNHMIRMIDSIGAVSTLAGQMGVTGSTNATGTAASFNSPMGVAVDTSGNVYVADTNNHLIRMITSGGVVTTLAGQAGVSGSANATGTSASFNKPTGVAVDISGNVYVADKGNNMIRMITSGGVVTTLAGQAGVTGSTNATGTAASFYGPWSVDVDTSGNVYVADYYNHLIRMITSGGVVTTLAGQAGVTGNTNATGTAASFNSPMGVAVDTSGNVYVGDSGNNMIRMITSGGVVSTLAGTGAQGEVNGPGTIATFDWPAGLAVDSGIVYVADRENASIRQIE